MSIKQIITNDIKDAMRAKDVLKRDTLRHLSAALKQVEVDERVELNDEQICKIIQSQIKKRNDSIEQYKIGERQDLVEKESTEIEIISAYLPKQLSDEELSNTIKEIIANINATTLKDLGMVMKEAKARIGAKADAKRISQEAKNQLGK